MVLEYTIQRSPKRRQLTITVERDRSVVVHAPEGLAEEKIRRVVEAKRQWIYEKINHPQKYRNLPHGPGKELVSGESALYLGRQYRIEVVKKGLAEVRFNRCFLISAVLGKRREEALREWYISRAKEKIAPRVKVHARQLGVEAAEVKIADSRYRWGSCTTRNNVGFNWRLIKAPMFVIDYVIVHELAHLIEANHTPRFWNIVRTQIPMMEKAKAWLKENGGLLEEAI
jgi:predicted metal-dependent hydrolase